MKTPKWLWLITLLAFSLAVAPPARAESPRVEIHVNGLYAWGDFDFSSARSFRVLGYDVRATAAYDLDSALGFDAGIQLKVVGPFGLRASVSHATHEGQGTLSVALPPALPGLPGHVEGVLPGGRVRETDVHASAVASLEAGQARLSALGGVTFFSLEASLVENGRLTVPGGGSIPVTGLRNLDLSDSPVGWHVGLGVDVQVAKHLALGGFVRYARGRAKLVPPAGSGIEIDAGGAHAGVGARFLF